MGDDGRSDEYNCPRESTLRQFIIDAAANSALALPPGSRLARTFGELCWDASRQRPRVASLLLFFDFI